MKFLPTEARQASPEEGPKEAVGSQLPEPNLTFLALKSGHVALMCLAFRLFAIY